MCLGGSSAPDYKPPAPRYVAPGPGSPQDKVNNQDVENINPRSEQEANRKANQKGTASGQKGSQSGSQGNRAY